MTSVPRRGQLVIGLTWRYCRELADAGNTEGAALLSELLCQDWTPCKADVRCAGCGRHARAGHAYWCALSTQRREAEELEQLKAMFGDEGGRAECGKLGH